MPTKRVGAANASTNHHDAYQSVVYSGDRWTRCIVQVQSPFFRLSCPKNVSSFLCQAYPMFGE